jgi:hypothetical protein
VSGDRGQASVELVGAGALMIGVALALAQLVLVWRAADRAHGLADQVAVVIAEGRRAPATIAGGRVTVSGGVVRVTVPVALVLGAGAFSVSATAHPG